MKVHTNNSISAVVKKTGQTTNLLKQPLRKTFSLILSCTYKTGTNVFIPTEPHVKFITAAGCNVTLLLKLYSMNPNYSAIKCNWPTNTTYYIVCAYNILDVFSYLQYL